MRFPYNRSISLLASAISLRPNPIRQVKIAGVATLGALLMIANVPTSASAQLLNGSFEIPIVPGNYTTYSTAPAGFGWFITSGTVDHGKGPAQTKCQHPAGNPDRQCIDLNGDGQGGIAQKFLTCKPKYRVKFFMSRHVQLGATPATLEASIDSNTPVTFTHSVLGVTSTTPKWQPRQFDFCATQPSHTLQFKSATNVASMPAAGPQIDNVTLKLVSCTATCP